MLFLFVALLFLNACSYFDEEEIKLPGKREAVFEKKVSKNLLNQINLFFYQNL